jgi:hypothetical protein
MVRVRSHVEELIPLPARGGLAMLREPCARRGDGRHRRTLGSQRPSHGSPYIRLVQRCRLPLVVADTDHVDLFIRDSLHTAGNTLFEMEQVAAKMPAGGVMLVDDIKAHNGFDTFARTHREYQTNLVPDARSDRDVRHRRQYRQLTDFLMRA